MSIYIGLIILDPIVNQLRYAQTLNELIHFAQTHADEINFSQNQKLEKTINLIFKFYLDLIHSDSLDFQFCGQRITDTVITIKPLVGNSQINFPLDPSYFRTSYFRISLESNETPDDYTRKFAQISWESCCILQENFPSQIELYQQDLQVCFNVESYSSAQELLRREINCLMSKSNSGELLQKDQMSDVFHVLESSLQMKNYKGVNICLSLIEGSQCPPCLLVGLSQVELSLLETIANQLFYNNGVNAPSERDQNMSLGIEPSYREYQQIKNAASSVICKILKLKNFDQQSQMYAQNERENKENSHTLNQRIFKSTGVLNDVTLQKTHTNGIQSQYDYPMPAIDKQNRKNISISDNNPRASYVIDDRITQNSNNSLIRNIYHNHKKSDSGIYDQPQTLKSFLFQLKQSTDIERITFILDNLMTKNLSVMQKLQNMDLATILDRIMDQYIAGDLGIDESDLTKYGVFHNRILKYWIKVLNLNGKFQLGGHEDLEQQGFTNESNSRESSQIEKSIFNNKTDLKIAQIIEQGVLNCMQNIINLDQNETNQQNLFFKQTILLLDFFASQIAFYNLGNLEQFGRNVSSIKEICVNYLGIPENYSEQDLLATLSQDIKAFLSSIFKILSKIEAFKDIPHLSQNSLISNK